MSPLMLRDHISLPAALLRRRRDVTNLRLAKASHRPPSKQLPFLTDIPVRSYLNQALPLSIVARDPAYRERLFESFIQVFFPDDKLDYDRVLMLPSLRAPDWERLGFLDTRWLNTHNWRLSRPAALMETLSDHLSQGSYIEIHIDEFYLPGRPCYGNAHSVHDNMLVGYDWTNRRFQLAGYGNDYEVAEFAFEDILKSFYHIPRSQLARRTLQLIKPKPGPRRGIDLNAVAAQLDDYLSSRATFNPEQMRRLKLYRKARRFSGTWGLETYTALRSYLEASAEDSTALDLRATRTLWEHKACMLARLRHLEAKNGFRDGRLFSHAYAPVEELARKVRFHAYEYNACGRNRQDLEPVADQLRRMCAIEGSVLHDVRSALKTDEGVPTENDGSRKAAR